MASKKNLERDGFLNCRLSDEQKAAIKLAASYTGRTVTQFIKDILLPEAERIVYERSISKERVNAG